MILVLAIVAILLCGCLIAVGGFAYSRYVAGQPLSGFNTQTSTVMPSDSPTPFPTSGSNTGTIPSGGLGNEITRATAWGSAITAILQANPTSCMSPDGAQTTIKVITQRKASGAWQERWTVACDGTTPIPVDITFTPAGGGQITVKAAVAT